MAVVEEDSDNKTHHSHQISTSTSIPMNNNYPNLFNKFMSSENQRRRRNLPLPTVKPIQQPFHVEEIDEEELELSLGLSMNGRFGVDPNAKKIKRTSSIPEFMIPVSEEETGHVIPAVVNGGGLIRTCSLPVESEEEWRKRKELQSIRRMEARRKRNEKQRNLRGMRERININVVGFEGGVVIEGGGVNSNNNLVDQGDDGLRRTTSLLRSRVGGIDLNCEKESPPQQGGSGSGGGSIGSYHGTGSSSGTSESEGQQHGQGKLFLTFFSSSINCMFRLLINYWIISNIRFIVALI